MSRETNPKSLLIIMAFLLTMLSTAALGRIIYVDDDGPADFNNIQSAINDSNNADVIIIKTGRYSGAGNRDIDFLGKAITVRSLDPNDPNIVATTVIYCNGTEPDPHRGFKFHSGEEANSVLAGLTITNGYGPEDYIGDYTSSIGGAILCSSSSPTISNCIITGNSAYNGGGICCCKGASPRIRDCSILNNIGVGGGIRLRESNAEIINCIIRNNLAPIVPGFPGNWVTSGGGIYCSYSNPNIIDCQFIDNVATGSGGAINSFLGSASVSNCLFSGNKAEHVDGGAIILVDDNSSFHNCVFSRNTAIEQRGGAIYCSSSNIGNNFTKISNCTISSNRAGKEGGGIYAVNSGTMVMVNNTILWSNSASKGAQIALKNGTFGPASLTISYGDVQGGEAAVYLEPGCMLNWQEGNIDIDPCFADPCNSDYHLKSQGGRWDAKSEIWVKDEVTSLCIDAGDPASPIGYEPFPNGGIINMGAYGGTKESSKSYFGEPVCETIVAGDINGDCKVDFKDFALMALHWLRDENQ